MGIVLYASVCHDTDRAKKLKLIFKKETTMSKYDCRTCGGTGEFDSGERCYYCQGDGEAECKACDGTGEIENN